MSGVARGGVGAGGSIIFTTYAVRYDDTGSGGISYIGEAAPGSATNSAVWRVKRMTQTGDDITIEWADGDDSFDNIWDNRASLSYS